MRDVRFTDEVLRILAATEALSAAPRLVSEAEFYGRALRERPGVPGDPRPGFRVTGSTEQSGRRGARRVSAGRSC